MKKIEKIFKFIENQGLTNQEFEKTVGLSNGYLRNIAKTGSEVSIKMLRRMFDSYPELENQLENITQAIEIQSELKRIPIIGEAGAATEMEIDVSPKMHPKGYVDVGDLLRDSETAMYVYGNSMTPNYPSGCLIGLKRNYDSYIQPGETYVIETRSNVVLKRLYETIDKEGFECISDNTMKYETGPRAGRYFYEPFVIPKKDVLRLFDVTGVIRRNRNNKF